MEWKKLPEMIRRIRKEQVICLAASVILAAASCMLASRNSYLSGGGVIARGSPGSTDKQYELNVSGIGERPETLIVRVSAREFTPEEAAAETEAVAEELSAHIIGGNESLDKVTTDLALKKTIPGHEGVRLNWYPERPALISYDGEVNNIDLEEPQQTFLRVVMKAGEYREEYAIPVTVYPAVATDSKDLLKKLSGAVRRADEEQISSKELKLPGEINGLTLSYEAPPDRTWMRLLALGVLAFALLGLKPGQDRRKQQKKRETELLTDYSDIVSKLVIYMGAGLTAGNAWRRIAENYEASVRNGSSAQRAAYEEMCRTRRELDKGVPESRAFQDFAGRCQLNCYLKLVTLLEQNRKTGDPRSENALLLEAQESFEQRKNMARRLGEEAGTKLMLPLIISLVSVMMIVAVPAMLTLA